MLYELPDGSKRLFKSSSDDYHFSRENSKTVPDACEIPEKYRYLLKWYKENYDTSTGQTTLLTPVDPLIDPEVKVTFISFSDEHQMTNFAYDCPDNIGSLEIQKGACKKCSNSISEDEVKKALAKALTDIGWKVNRIAMGTKHGIDIEATQNQNRMLIIEAKGEGSLNPMRVNFFLMVLGELLQKMDSPDKKYGIALPAHQQYVKLIHKLPTHVKQQMKLHIFLTKRVGEHNYTVGHYAYQG
jgi:hypothetical protein